MRGSIEVRPYVVERTSALRHRERVASRFPASAVARSASTSLPRPGGAHPHSAALPPDETIHACAPGSPTANRPPWDAVHSPANSPRAQRTLLSAAVAPLPATYYAWLRGRCTWSPDATSLSTSIQDEHSTQQIPPAHDPETARAPQPTTPCSSCRYT